MPSTTPSCRTPRCRSRLDLDAVWRLTDELIAAEAEWLPAWLRG